MAQNLRILFGLLQHATELERALGPAWTEIRTRILQLLETVRAGGNDATIQMDVDQILQVCLAASASSDIARRVLRDATSTASIVRSELMPDTGTLPPKPPFQNVSHLASWVLRNVAPAGHSALSPSDAEEVTRVVIRTPHMDLLEVLHPGQDFTVRVFLDRQTARPGEESWNVELMLSALVVQIDLEVWLAGTMHFEFPRDRLARLIIDLAQPDEVPSVEFVVRVREDVATPSVGGLTANFTYQGRASGHVRRSIAIVSNASQPEGVGKIAGNRTNQECISLDVLSRKADLCIQITDPDNTKRHLHCFLASPHLTSNDLGAPFTWNLDGSSGELVRAFMSEFVKAKDSNEGRLLSLKGAGRLLWDASPRSFRDAFWKIFDTGKLNTISIVSEEPYWPWELMVPRRQGVMLGALGAQFTVGRWLPADFVAPAQDLMLSHSVVVAPVYPGPRPRPLKHSTAEARRVLDTVPGELAHPATLSGVRTTLASSAASLVHLVCHGSEGPFGIQIIELESGQFTSLQVSGMDDLRPFFRRHRPLVFLNACEIGRLTTALVGVGGFAKAFIDLGAGAVIAPLWSVKDTIAHEIAEVFYCQLKKCARIRPAEVFKDLRKRAYELATAGEDTYAAYCFYGDPQAICALPQKSD